MLVQYGRAAICYKMVRNWLIALNIENCKLDQFFLASTLKIPKYVQYHKLMTRINMHAPYDRHHKASIIIKRHQTTVLSNLK